MNKIITILFLLPLFIQAQTIRCKELREGVFKLNDNSAYILIRGKTIQIEKDIRTGNITQFDITWLSDCKYILYNKKLLRGKDDVPSEFKIDTVFNDIGGINGNRHQVRSYATGFNPSETEIRKIDTTFLYRHISELSDLKDYTGDSYIGSLIDDSFALHCQSKKDAKTNYVLVFEEMVSLNDKAKFLFLDAKFFKKKENQHIATKNCRYGNHYDREIVVVYSSDNKDAEAKIHKAWRMNRKTLKIEKLNPKKVKFKEADRNLFLWK